MKSQLQPSGYQPSRCHDHSAALGKLCGSELLPRGWGRLSTDRTRATCKRKNYTFFRMSWSPITIPSRSSLASETMASVSLQMMFYACVRKTNSRYKPASREALTWLASTWMPAGPASAAGWRGHPKGEILSGNRLPTASCAEVPIVAC